ncbi:tRNA (guanosine(46)-N7)-methyltransferase TrmB [Azotosporobacter soli]|uniref:tRNA (guanosine(46)-N7)-methyltransferase TrmB n=1 Tax=Azotosporobacter soli TaxID=3055040 RepID=UPI0031FE4634
MRLRKKPWIGEALDQFNDILVREHEDKDCRGRWRQRFAAAGPLHVEVGTGKGSFITEMAARHPDILFIGIEGQQDVIYQAVKRAAEQKLVNLRLLLADVGRLTEFFAPGEMDRLFINFCDPWPKVRHAKRRLTHARFLARYREVLAAQGDIWFKTDNRPLFDFSLEEFAANGLELVKVSYDLHSEDWQDNVMTEYERKFSALGTPINRCEARFAK